MLGEFMATATIAVKDLGRARQFYEEVLGLKREKDEQPMVVTYRNSGSRVLVYQSSFAGTNQATAATWDVDDVEAEVRTLKGKGVAFEHYDFPGIARQGDVHLMEPGKAAWFKDPDGNILAIVGR